MVTTATFFTRVLGSSLQNRSIEETCRYKLVFERGSADPCEESYGVNKFGGLGFLGRLLCGTKIFKNSDGVNSDNGRSFFK